MFARDCIERLRRDGFAFIGEAQPSMTEGVIGEIVGACLRNPSIAYSTGVDHDRHALADVIPHRRTWHYDRPVDGWRAGDTLPALRPGDSCWLFALWADVDFTLANGATHLVPGSHLRAEMTPTEIESVREYVVLEMPRGSAAMWIGTHVLHRAGINQSGQPRPSRLLRIRGLWAQPEAA